jgi:transcriptional regulator with XRE-family HTH domain
VVRLRVKFFLTIRKIKGGATVNESINLKNRMGRRIRLIRKANDLTQVELAKRLGYTSSGTIAQIEAGSKGMTLDKLLQLGREFGINPALFMVNDSVNDEQFEMVLTFNMLLQRPQDRHYGIVRDILKIYKEEISQLERRMLSL